GGVGKFLVRKNDGGRKAVCSSIPIRVDPADDPGGRIGLDVEAVFHDGFNRHGAGDFTMGFAPHTVGEHEELQRLNNFVAIFVVCTHATHIGHAASRDSHTNSYCRPELTPPAHTCTRRLYSHANRAPRPAKGFEPY